MPLVALFNPLAALVCLLGAFTAFFSGATDRAIFLLLLVFLNYGLYMANRGDE